MLKDKVIIDVLKKLFFPMYNLEEVSLDLNFNWEDFQISDLRFLLHLSSINNVEFQLVKNLLSKHIFQIGSEEEILLNKVLECCCDNQRKYLKTLEYIIPYLTEKNIEYMVIKSYAPYDFIRDDIDILIIGKKKYLETIRFLENNNWQPSNRQNSQVHFDRDGMVQIDLHKWVGWDNLGTSGIGGNLFDNNELWEKHRKVNFNGMDINVPSVEDDVLIIIAHSIFQHHYTTLNERIHVAELIKSAENIDFDYINKTADAARWQRGIKTLFYHVNEEYKYLFSRTLVKGKDILFSKEVWFEESLIMFHPLKWIIRLYLDIIKKDGFSLNKYLKVTINLIFTIYRLIKFKIFGVLSFNSCFLKSHNLCKL